MKKVLIAAAIASAGLFASTPASAALTFVRACGASDITLPAGATFTSCAGYYNDNLFNNASNADIQAGLTALGAPAGIFTTFAAIPAANKLSNLNGATVINFGQTLFGDTIVGVHFGAGQGSPGFGKGPPGPNGKPKNVDTSVFYRFDAGVAGISSFTLNYSASSNAVLFQTGQPQPPVPEPATWAMMLGGFGLLGATARRRRRVTVTFA
jgi:hypothetical protein